MSADATSARHCTASGCVCGTCGTKGSTWPGFEVVAARWCARVRERDEAVAERERDRAWKAHRR